MIHRFFIQENDKIGIIGINGTGKSTLLKIIAGVEEPQQGTVTKANGTVISFLSQHPIFSEDETIIEHVLKNNTEKNHAWDIETQAKSLLTKFGLTDFNQKRFGAFRRTEKEGFSYFGTCFTGGHSCS